MLLRTCGVLGLAVLLAPGVQAAHSVAGETWTVELQPVIERPVELVTTEGREASSWTLVLGGAALIALRLRSRWR